MKNSEIRNIVLISTAITVILSGFCLFINTECSLICFALGALLTLLLVAFTKKRYRRLSELNDYLSAVCSGKYDLDIEDNTEGELSILKNNLYKVISILRTQNEMLKNDKVYLADSLADISHQLKTPLSSMMVMTDLLSEEEDESKRAQFIEVIENQLEKMKWLITNLLKLSKLDAGTIRLKKEENSITEIIEAVASPFEILLELKQIELDKAARNFSICIDKSWTVEALQNILKNCIEHTNAGGRISISTERTNIYDSVIIKDNGVGIAPEDLPHIFERFYHGKNSSKESIGIGLALSKAILEKENADIIVISHEDKGTEFEVRFYKGIV